MARQNRQPLVVGAVRASEPIGSGSLEATVHQRLVEYARRIRVEVIRAVTHARGGHLGGPLSAADILAVLYGEILNVRPDDPVWPGRDRFILSKGHSSIALYAALALRGYFPVAELGTFDAIDSRLQGHPDMTRLPGLDMSTGSLGLGLSAGVGMAIGLRRRTLSSRVVVMLGDGECQEGAVWESAFIGERYGLGNLVVVVDSNRLQQFGWPSPSGPEVRLPPWREGELHDRWRAFGWEVLEVDGHDVAALTGAFKTAWHGDSRPTVVLAHTIKGKGVSFMEDRYVWHTRVPTPEELAQAMAELGEAQ